MTILKNIIYTFIVSLIFASCQKEILPKPAAQLRLDYPIANYQIFDKDCPFNFEYNQISIVKMNQNCNLQIQYPKLKATIYISYKPVAANLNRLLNDAQKLTFEHVIKADEIIDQQFINKDNQVYGMFYEVSGNAATNAQFYVTDSTHNFIDCSLYFYAKPNFDSIYPAVNYIKNDMRKLMETIRWKN